MAHHQLQHWDFRISVPATRRAETLTPPVLRFAAEGYPHPS
jgi:hypothetical protein